VLDITKETFFVLILPVLNVATTVASTERCSGCNQNLLPLRTNPVAVMRSVRPGDMVVGKHGSYSKSVMTPSGNLSSTDIDIREQSLEPLLSTNKSNLVLVTKTPLFPLKVAQQKRQFCISNNWGLARLGKMDFKFTKKPSGSFNRIHTAITIRIIYSNNDGQSNTEIPFKYILYEWAFFILTGLVIIDEIIRQVKKRMKNSDF
jgi:hypothetical protein